MGIRVSLLACVFVVGCIHSEVQRLDSAVRPVRSPDSVAILFEAPSRAFTVIAVIDGTGKTVFDGVDDLREHLQAEAAKLGGDAVIVRTESTDTEFILTGTAMIKSDTRRAVGEVIVFDG